MFDFDKPVLDCGPCVIDTARKIPKPTKIEVQMGVCKKCQGDVHPVYMDRGLCEDCLAVNFARYHGRSCLRNRGR